MSEDFVDVTWRGLEVVKKAKLRGTGPHRAYLEHGTPMPTGSQLVIRTADGHELGAIVAKVQEQIGGRAEPPGMEVTIEATGAAATWWLARAEAAAAARERTPSTAPPVAAAERAPTPGAAERAPMPGAAERAPMPAAASRATMTMQSMPDLVPPPMPEQPMAPMETGPTRPSARAAAVTVPPPVDAPRGEPPAIEPAAADDGRRTEVMISVAAIEAAEAEAAADSGDAIPQGIDDSVDRPADPIVDDGRRTLIMPAVDIAAIVEASSRDGEGGDDDGPGGSGGTGVPAGEKKKARGKRRGRGR